MNILSLNIADLGGLSYNLCQAINKHTDHQARSILINRSFTRKPFMVRRKDSKKFKRQIRSWVRNADVLHFNERWVNVAKYWIDPKQCKDKKIIYHAHGSIFRHKSRKILRLYRRAFPQMKIITSTPDLNRLAGEDATWFPSVVPILDYRKKYKRARTREKRNKPPIVYYSPSQSSTKGMKNTIRSVSRELRKEGVKFKLQVTTGTLHTKNMRMKAQADIYYDEIRPSPFYGVNAIEAGVLEKAVICNMNPYARTYMKNLYEQEGINCPFTVVANRKPLKRALRKLVKNKKHRVEQGKLGLKYVRKMHGEQVCVKRFMELVEH